MAEARKTLFYRRFAVADRAAIASRGAAFCVVPSMPTTLLPGHKVRAKSDTPSI